MKSIYTSLLSATLLMTSIEPAQAGNETSPPPTINPANSNIPAESNLSPISTNSNLSQQAGVIQNNSGWGGFGTPNCGGACLVANVRVVPNGNSNNIEASIGLMWQFSSPENIQAQAHKAKTDAEREQLTAQTDLTLIEKLAAAIEKKQPVVVNAIAMILAKRFGYSDYQQYLRDVYRIDRNYATIDVPINY
jgi:hypothetical protein